MTRENTIGNGEITSFVLEGVKSWEDPRIKPEWIEQILNCRNSSGFVPTDDDVRRHLHGDVLTLGFRNEIVVGFNCIEFKSPKEVWGGLITDHELPSDPGVYLAGVLIDGSAQKSGFYQRMNKDRVTRGVEKGFNIIFTETANPNVEAGIKDTLDSMKENGQIVDYSMEDRIYLKALYGRRMYTEAPKNAKVSFDDLNYDAGDAYAIIFHLTLK
jgi:hypothetical protein